MTFSRPRKPIPITYKYLSIFPLEFDQDTELPDRIVSIRIWNWNWNWKSKELLNNQQQASFFSRMEKRLLSTTKYKHFRVMKKSAEQF
jgi:hypothetical protein